MDESAVLLGGPASPAAERLQHGAVRYGSVGAEPHQTPPSRTPTAEPAAPPSPGPLRWTLGVKQGSGDMDARPMATHHLGTRHIPDASRMTIAAIVVLAVAVTLGAAPASAGTPGDCVVRNGRVDRAYKRLQPAVDAARRGDRLTVRGTCRGSTIIDRKLAIVGVPSQELGRPILSGAGKGRVLRVEPGILVRVQDLVVLRGKMLTSRASPGMAVASPIGAS